MVAHTEAGGSLRVLGQPGLHIEHQNQHHHHHHHLHHHLYPLACRHTCRQNAVYVLNKINLKKEQNVKLQLSREKVIKCESEGWRDGSQVKSTGCLLFQRF